MLMMSRREGEAILIGGGIEIVIARIGRSRVKVGICDPRDMPIVAREVQLVRDENLAAASVVSSAGLPALAALFQNPSSSSSGTRR
jgi:carbon storage regulator